ncbi:MAG: GIY-YIG nuclease family protein [Patescibacteria group bacterium]|jgi:putative endonuclease
MHYLYILQSLRDNGYYIGITENIEQRLKAHNAGKTKSLLARLPVVLKHIEKYDTTTEARKREIQLKKNYQLRKQLLTQLGFVLK